MLKKKNTLKTLLSSSLILSSYSFASPIDILPSNQSFSGLFLTPNAQTTPEGQLTLSNGAGLPFGNEFQALNNHVAYVGVTKNMEAAGRFVTRYYDCNMYLQSNCTGPRDLSASAKYKLPFINDWFGIDMALGYQDIGGAANHFNTYYAVADKTFSTIPLRISAGYGQSDLALNVLNGPFGGIEWQPFPFMQIIGEYDSQSWNVGGKLVTPKNWLPMGMQASMQYLVATGHENADEKMWATNVSIPLQGYRLSQPNLEAKLSDEHLLSLASNHTNGNLSHLMQLLREEGFINLQAGILNEKLIIKLENRRYSHNQLDALGVAMGIIAANAGENLQQSLKLNTRQIDLVLLTNNLPTFAVHFDPEKYQRFLAQEATNSTAQAIKIPHLAQVNWQHQTLNNGFGRNQIIVSPIMNHTLGTEYGAFDYSFGVASNLYTPLWSGAAIDVQYVTPLANSDDFEKGGYWGNSQLEEGVNRALIHQAFVLPQNIYTQFTAGIVYKDYLTALNETVWLSPSGKHQLGLQVSRLTPKASTSKLNDKQTQLLHYQYALPNWNWQMKVEGGEFLEGDKGMKLTTTHWLGDVAVAGTYLQSEEEQFLTLGITFPISLWRGMKPHYVQARGIDAFEYALRTRIGEEHNQINTSLGNSVNLQHSLSRQYLNRDRLSQDYFNANQDRLRNAYLKYLDITIH